MAMDKTEVIRAVILGLVVALYTSTVTSWIAKIPLVGGVVTSYTIVGTAIGAGLLVLAVTWVMDQVKALR